MKDILKIIIPIILVIIITLICCHFFIKPNLLNFKETTEFRYIENNKNNIDEFIIKTVTLLGEHCYKIDINKGYDILNNTIIKKESKSRCMDSDMYLEIYFNNGTNRKILYECENLVYNNIRYELKNQILLVNKDEYMPDKITQNMIIISDKDKIACK
jgi:hypothetical protein